MSARRSPNSALTPSPSLTHRASRQLRSVDLWHTLLVAAVVVVVAYDNGGYGLSSRAILGISLWWGIILGFGLGLLPLARAPRTALITGCLLTCFAAWTLASVG